MTFNPDNKISINELNPVLQTLINSKASTEALTELTNLEATDVEALTAHLADLNTSVTALIDTTIVNLTNTLNTDVNSLNTQIAALNTALTNLINNDMAATNITIGNMQNAITALTNRVTAKYAD